MFSTQAKHSLRSFRSVLLILLLILAGGTIQGQTITGTIRGFVTDPIGAVVNGATVTVSNTNTGVSKAAVTDHSGLYNLPFLPIGTYTVSAVADGFNPSGVAPFTLEIDQIATVNLTLHVGSQNALVNVDSTLAPILNTENSTLGATLSAATLSALPLNGRNFSSRPSFFLAR